MRPAVRAEVKATVGKLIEYFEAQEKAARSA